MIYKVTTDTPLEQVKNELAEHAKRSGFGVLGSYEFKKILEGKGFPIEKDITVYELCSPSAAQEALAALPEVSVYLPCRISLYEENGKTIIATINIFDVMNSINASEELHAHMNSVYKEFELIMNSWN
ncbi:MAG: DUF302 domain-containing protein [Sulfurimonas sp.]|nr:DUF302 domain-containing protein [Sulfurimonas sp.]MDQ7068401.1 DUF302 domain-containing protein [Sulfurimonas sp.]